MKITRRYDKPERDGTYTWPAGWWWTVTCRGFTTGGATRGEAMQSWYDFIAIGVR